MGTTDGSTALQISLVRLDLDMVPTEFHLAFQKPSKFSFRAV